MRREMHSETRRKGERQRYYKKQITAMLYIN